MVELIDFLPHELWLYIIDTFLNDNNNRTLLKIPEFKEYWPYLNKISDMKKLETQKYYNNIHIDYIISTTTSIIDNIDLGLRLDSGRWSNNMIKHQINKKNKHIECIKFLQTYPNIETSIIYFNQSNKTCNVLYPELYSIKPCTKMDILRKCYSL